MMRRMTFLAPLAAVVAISASAQAHAQPRVDITVGPRLEEQVDKLGVPEVNQQIAKLQARIETALAARYPGATAELVLTDLKPNRPTREQLLKTPGLDPLRSVSIGGAAIEGQIVTAEGERRPVTFSYYTSNLRDVYGYSVWWDADRAFERFADRIETGRY